MPTIRRSEKIENQSSPIKLTHTEPPLLAEQVKKTKFREYLSWSVCFGVIAGITGLMKMLKVGITMDTVTSFMLYFSLAGLIYFISRMISISRNPIQDKTHAWHELN